MDLFGVARHRATVLPALRAALPPDWFRQIRQRIKKEAGGRNQMSLPVPFFMLVRGDAAFLQRFDRFPTALAGAGLWQERASLLRRLFQEYPVAVPAGAVFEIDILTRLLSAEPTSMTSYPKVAGVKKRPEALIRLSERTIYVEATALQQAVDQELVERLSLASTRRPLSEEEQETLKEQRVWFAAEGVVGRTGRPYNDVYRVVRKIWKDKRPQLVSDSANVLCLQLIHSWPDLVTVELAVNALFSGSTAVLARLRDEVADGLARNRGVATPNEIASAEKLIQDVNALMGELAAESRLTGVAVYGPGLQGPVPARLLRNPSPGQSNALEEDEWRRIAMILGFG